MRVRTDQRRQAIIDVALEVFREHGFERASMTMISQRLGGSKGTLYGYFQSKEELFETAMKAASEGRGDQVMALLDPEAEDLRAMLERFASVYVAFIIADDVMPITRTAIAEGSASELGPHLFAQGPGRAIDKLRAYLACEMERGRLRRAPAHPAAIHLKGLIEAGFLEEALYGAPTPEDQQAYVVDAIDIFLRAYANAGTP